MTWQALPPTNGCPNCGLQPRVKARFYFGFKLRAECSCGVAAPYVTCRGWNDREALQMWSKVAGPVRMPQPPPPAKND